MFRNYELLGKNEWERGVRVGPLSAEDFEPSKRRAQSPIQPGVINETIFNFRKKYDIIEFSNPVTVSRCSIRFRI